MFLHCCIVVQGLQQSQGSYCQSKGGEERDNNNGKGATSHLILVTIRKQRPYIFQVGQSLFEKF